MNSAIKISLVTFLISLSACTSKIEIDGDAFRETQSNVVKLPLIDIQVVPEDKFIENLELQAPLISKEINQLLESMVIANEGMKTAGSINSIIQYSVEGQLIIKKMKDLESGISSKWFPKNIGGSKISTTTDSNGKFQLSVPKGGNYILIGVKDNLAWALRIDPEKSFQKITLTPKNLSGSGCDGCVFGNDFKPADMYRK